MNWRRALGLAVFTLPLVALLSLGFGHDPRATPSLLEGREAPVFELKDLTGQPHRLADLRGQPVVINFWASWCFPCLAEHATLQTAAQELAGRVHFLGVIYEDTPGAIAQFLADKQNNFPQLVDPNSKTALDYGVAGVPESFIIDRDGVVQHKEAGVLSEATLRRYLLPLLQNRSKPADVGGIQDRRPKDGP